MHLEFEPPYTSSEGEVPAASDRTKRWPARLFLVSLLTVHAVLLGFNAAWMSPTLDEPAHLVSGISHWRYGDFSLYRVNPPLVRMVAAIPVMLAGYNFEFPDLSKLSRGRHEFRLGEEFVHANGRRTLWLTTIARWACIPFSLLGALVCYLWARDLYGKLSGMLASTLWCFSPMVLGHAALFTPDAHAAALGLLACYLFWLWLKAPSWRLTVFAGVILGLAELGKTTLILLYPIWPLLWFIYRMNEARAIGWKQWRDEALMLASRMVIGLYVVNLGYLGSGSFIPLNEYSFSSSLFGGENRTQAISASTEKNRFHTSWLGHLPVPLPYDYVMGIDTQQRDFESFGRPSYLRGVFQEKGWWYYYAYAALVKTPLGTWCLISLAAYGRCLCPISGKYWRDEMVLVVPAAVIFAVVSAKTGFSHHYRYVFPCLPLVMIWTSRQLAFARFENICTSPTGPLHSSVCVMLSKAKWVASCGLTATFLVLSVGSSLSQFPYSLSYFNESIGGLGNGADHLINSNIDWGQDLLHLEKWIHENAEGRKVYLAFDNYFNPFDLGIAQISPWPFEKSPREGSSIGPLQIPEGYYAISINQLYEFPWPIYELDGTRYYLDTRPLIILRAMRYSLRVGNSIQIYSSEEIRQAYRQIAVNSGQ